MEDKFLIRKDVKQRISMLSLPEKERQAKDICKRLKKDRVLLKAKNILVYSPQNNEINIIPIINFLYKLQKKIYFPVSYEEEMKFYEVTGDEFNNFSGFVYGRYKIREPKSRREYKEISEDVIIVPGVVFDPFCNRMGHGKGYYDKYLSCHNLISIGAAFNEQIYEHLESEPHDKRVDYLYTEKKIYINAK